jgi:hypothetical protein
LQYDKTILVNVQTEVVSMKKAILLLVAGVIFSTSAYAERIPFYSATTSLWKEMGENGTMSSTFFYAPAVIVSAVVETVFAPPVALWNIGRYGDDEGKEKSE